MITDITKTIALNAVISATIDKIQVISLEDANGEIFRKIPTDTEIISSQEKRFTFYINENEGNGEIVSVSLYGDGATETFGTGTEFTKQSVSISKTAELPQSLTFEWTVKVV